MSLARADNQHEKHREQRKSEGECGHQSAGESRKYRHRGAERSPLAGPENVGENERILKRTLIGRARNRKAAPDHERQQNACEETRNYSLVRLT